MVDAVLLVIVLVAVLVVSLRQRGLGRRERFSFAPRVRPVPASLRRYWIVRHHTRLGALLALGAGVALPLVVTAASRHYLYAHVLLMALVAVSLTVLTGWAGQLSLGQFALVGGRHDDLRAGAEGCFPVAVLVGGGCGAGRAVVGAPPCACGAVPGRRSLPWRSPRPAAVAPGVLGDDEFDPLLRRPVVGGVDLASQRTYYTCAWVRCGGRGGGARVRRSGIGRSLLAVRDNELAAAAMGLSPTRVKLLAFGVSGALAGLAGGGLVGLLVQFTPDHFQATESLTVVAIAVVGGLSSITGALLGSVLIVGLPAFFPDSPEVALLTSGVGLLVLLLYFPGGLVQILFSGRDAVFRALAARLPEPSSPGRPAVPRLSRRVNATPTDRPLRRAAAGPARARLRSPTWSVRSAGTVVDRCRCWTPGRGRRPDRANGAGSRPHGRRRRFVPPPATVEVLRRDVSRRRPTVGPSSGSAFFQDAALFPDLTCETPSPSPPRRTTGPGWPPWRSRFPAPARRAAKLASPKRSWGSWASAPTPSGSSVSCRPACAHRELACLLATDARGCARRADRGDPQSDRGLRPPLLRVSAELDASMRHRATTCPLVMSITTGSTA